MSAFGRVLGTTFAVVLVSKVGLTVAFYADEGNTAATQTIAKTVTNNTSQSAKPSTTLVDAKKQVTTTVALN